MNKAAGAVLATCALVISGAAWAQKDFDLGKHEYDSKCASCHGISGKGDGPVRKHLVKAPSDLTTLTKRSGGAFPTQLVWQIIDGRPATEIGPHGTREMPVWGNEYRAEVLRAAGPEAFAVAQPEWYVRGRIVALIDYLVRIQAK
jgi:mono/diheme cytochrome c family protein